MTRVRVTRDGESEEIDVAYTKEYDYTNHNETDDNGYTNRGTVLHGLQPNNQDILESYLIWLSGSLGDPRSHGEGQFPLVYVPEDYADVEVINDGPA